ncbi:hypothetical protein N7504_010734 [Penicillium tannophilum]|nr:hypothetical protein N7504_010734 [Penicillium tannophilum]
MKVEWEQEHQECSDLPKYNPLVTRNNEGHGGLVDFPDFKFGHLTESEKDSMDFTNHDMGHIALYHKIIRRHFWMYNSEGFVPQNYQKCDSSLGNNLRWTYIRNK